MVMVKRIKMKLSLLKWVLFSSAEKIDADLGNFVLLRTKEIKFTDYTEQLRDGTITGAEVILSHLVESWQ